MLFPDNKRFAFSILDDTDDSTLQNVKPVYEALKQLGFRTTKTVWPLDCPEGSRIFFAADTLQSKPYLEFVHGLAADGFEIAFHGATMESSLRERTIRALDFLKQEFGRYPRLFCNHGQNRENLYWGSKRFQTTLFRQLFRIARKEQPQEYSGELEKSDYFWGDLCKEYFTYVRNFAFNQINMLKVSPGMPYRLRDTQYVNFWFSTSDAPNVHAFNRLLDYKSIDELEREGGVCIISTHLGKGFVRDDKVNAATVNVLRYIAGKPGWFVPVSNILDYLLEMHGSRNALSDFSMWRLECKFMLDKILKFRNVN